MFNAHYARARLSCHQEPIRAAQCQLQVPTGANCRCPERRSDDAQTILEGTPTGLKTCPDLVLSCGAKGIELLTSCMPSGGSTSTHLPPCAGHRPSHVPTSPPASEMRCCTSLLYSTHRSKSGPGHRHAALSPLPIHWRPLSPPPEKARWRYCVISLCRPRGLRPSVNHRADLRTPAGRSRRH